MNPERLIAYRKQAAVVVEAVICDMLSARQALNTWPVLGNEDPSVRCLYTMLWFFEGDETRHDDEVYYCDVQLQHLKAACQILERGEALPEKTIQEYQGYFAPCEYSNQSVWRQPLWWFREKMAAVTRIISSNPWLQQGHVKSQHNKPLNKN